MLARLAVLALALMPAVALAQAAHVDRVGDTYELRQRVEQVSSGDGSSGASSSGYTVVERVVAVRDGGVELEFDLPAPVSEGDRLRTWQLPALVFKTPGRPLELLNFDEVEARAMAWLEAAGLGREHCGQWVFTWRAFKIEREPKSALDMLAVFDMRIAGLSAGASFISDGALAAATLKLDSRGPQGTVLVAEMVLDPDTVRRGRAENAVAVAQMTGQPLLSLEAALTAEANHEIAGTIVTRITIDRAGRVVGLTRVTEVAVGVGRTAERLKTTMTIERVPLARADGTQAI